MLSAAVKVQLLNKVGLHARPASQFVQTAARFASSVTIEYNAKKANAKSILQVLSLGAGGGAEISIHAEGEDAEAAVAALQQLIADKFGEAE